MNFFANTSLKRKQMLVIMLTSGAALLLASAAFLTFDVIALRRDMVGNLSTLSQLVGRNSTAGLDFNHPKAVEETLAALRAEVHIMGAAAYDKNGGVFATYDRGIGGRKFTTPA